MYIWYYVHDLLYIGHDHVYMYNNMCTKLDFQIFMDMEKYINIGYSRYVMVCTFIIIFIRV